MATYVLLFGALLGLIAGLAICYWKQLKSAYENRDTIGAAGNIYDSASSIFKKL